MNGAQRMGFHLLNSQRQVIYDYCKAQKGRALLLQNHCYSFVRIRVSNSSRDRCALALDSVQKANRCVQ